MGNKSSKITTSHWGAFNVFVENGRIINTEPFHADPAPPNISQLVPNAVRSSHPIYSCIAVGPLAIELEKHTVQSGAYDPYGLVIEHSGKNLMLGTIDEINCPMPFHFAQQTLGHTRTHPLKGVFKTSYLNKAGEVADHIMREIGGCTRGVHNIWGRHLAQKAVVFGQVGRSLSGLVDAAKSFAICVDVLRNQPGLIRCDNNLCLSCYGRYRYKKKS